MTRMIAWDALSGQAFFLRSMHKCAERWRMPCFGEKLREIINAEKVPQVELAQRSGVNQSTIARLIGGMRPERETLRRVIEAATEDPDRRFDLVWAHMIDEVGSLALTRAALDDAKSEFVRETTVTVDPSLREPLQMLAELAASVSEVRGVILSLGELALSFAAQKSTLGRIYPINTEDSAIVAEPEKSSAQPTNSGPEVAAQAASRRGSKERTGSSSVEKTSEI